MASPRERGGRRGGLGWTAWTTWTWGDGVGWPGRPTPRPLTSMLSTQVHETRRPVSGDFAFFAHGLTFLAHFGRILSLLEVRRPAALLRHPLFHIPRAAACRRCKYEVRKRSANHSSLVTCHSSLRRRSAPPLGGTGAEDRSESDNDPGTSARVSQGSMQNAE